MAPGDTLVLYTDGTSERRNRGNMFFDENGIEAALRSNGHRVRGRDSARPGAGERDVFRRRATGRRHGDRGDSREARLNATAAAPRRERPPPKTEPSYR